jgi:hypothetical protein
VRPAGDPGAPSAAVLITSLGTSGASSSLCARDSDRFSTGMMLVDTGVQRVRDV